MKFIVTGGAGFIGSYIVRDLLEKGHTVKIVDNCHVGKENVEDKVDFFNVDIRNKIELNKIIKDCDGIFHEAGLTSVSESFKKMKEYHDVNVVGTENIFQIAKEHKIRVVFASSSSVYGNTQKIPIKETSKTNSISPYGKSKIDAEKLAEKYFEQGLDVVGLRYFNVYGKGQTTSYAGVILKFLENIKLQKPFKIFGDGFQIRDFIHVKDIASANIAAMNSKIKSGFFNIGTGKPTTINELANTMIEISGHKEGINHAESLEGDIKISLADITNAQKLFHWNYSINLKNGLEKLIEDYL